MQSGPSGSIARGAVTFSFFANEAGSRFECRLDGPGVVTGAYQSCASPATYSSLADGSYTFLVRAIDAAGNTDLTPTTRAFTIVAPAGSGWAPQPPVITSPTSYGRTNKRSVTVSGTAEPGSTVQVFDSGNVLGSTVASAAGTWSAQLNGLADSTYLLTAKASNLGGTSAASGALVLFVDATPPNPPVFVAPAAGSSVGTTFTISGTAEAGTTLELFEDGVSQRNDRGRFRGHLVARDDARRGRLPQLHRAGDRFRGQRLGVVLRRGRFAWGRKNGHAAAACRVEPPGRRRLMSKSGAVRRALT